VLARRLAAENFPMLKGKEIKLLAAHSYARVIPGGTRIPVKPVMNVGAPVLANVVGNLLGLGLVSLFQPGDQVLVGTRLEVVVDGKSFSGQSTVMDKSLADGSRVREAVRMATEQLIAQLGYGQGYAVNESFNHTPLPEPPGTPVTSEAPRPLDLPEPPAETPN
jgi:hypothetical protein